MKLNFKYTLATLALAGLFASCDRTAEFKSEKFISVDNTSYTVTEVAGEVTIPVHVYNADSEVNVSVTIIPGTAEEGTDYEVTTPASGVLAFAPGETTKEVKVAIKAHEGVYTGNKNFAVQVASATDGVVVGNLNTAVVTVTDLDHPLSSILGEYVATGLCASAGGQASWAVTFAANDESISKVNVINLSWFDETLVGDVSEDLTTITIPYGQMYIASGYYTMFCGWSAGGYYSPSGNLILTKTDAGWVQSSDLDTADRQWGIGCLATDNGTPLGWLDYMYPGLVLTK